MSYKVTRSTDFLSHFRLKGQKWGIRRFQNEDGTLTPAGRERYYRKHENEIINKSLRYEDDYDNTVEGKKLRKQYVDLIDKLENSRSTTEEEFENFYKVEEQYLKGQATYVGKKLLNEYGLELFSSIAKRGSQDIYETGEEAVNDFVKREWRVHAY